VQYGFGRPSHTLLRHGLLDELRLWVHPFFVSRGARLFAEGPPVGFEPAGVRPLRSGIVILSYRAAAR
jgi:dihydrofolate reductase